MSVIVWLLLVLGLGLVLASAQPQQTRICPPGQVPQLVEVAPGIQQLRCVPEEDAQSQQR